MPTDSEISPFWIDITSLDRHCFAGFRSLTLDLEKRNLEESLSGHSNFVLQFLMTRSNSVTSYCFC